MTAVDLDLERFFDQATRAVVDSQNRLDRDVNPAAVSGARPGQQLFYSLPRATFALESEIVFSKKGRLLLRRKQTTTTLTHRVGFELIAVPEPPPPPLGDPSIELIEPAFLIPGAEEARLAAVLTAALETGVGGDDWWFVDEHETLELLARDPTGATVRAEAVRIALALQAPGRENGRLVFFRLGGGRVLAARVEGSQKGRDDGLFVIQPDDIPRVVIHTIPDDPWPREVSYEPLLLLARNVRRWLAGELADQRSTWRPSQGLGFEDLDDFLDTLKDLLHGHLTRLAQMKDPFAGAAADAVVPRGLPSFYDLAEMQARLSFSVETETGRVSFRKRGDGETAEETVANQVMIRARSIEGRLEITLRLADLEFLPRGEAREALLELILEDDHAKAVARKMGDPPRYAELLRKPELRRGAVVFRARSPELGKIAEELVVVWPGGAGDQQLDFVFSCTRKGGKIENVQKVMGLDDGARGVRLRLKQYGPFHRFLAAVGLWSHRGRSA